MKKALFALSLIVLVGAGLSGVSHFWGDGRSEDRTEASTSDAESASATTRGADELARPQISPDGSSSEALAPGARAALVSEREGERFLDWTAGEERWIEGQVEIPPGVAPDETLRVVALSEPARPNRLLGTGGIFSALAEGGDPPSTVVSTEPVSNDGRFRIPIAPELEVVYLALDGRHLFLRECQRVDSLSGGTATCRLSPRVGASIRGRVSLPEDVDDPRTRFTTCRVDLNPDSTQFSMVSGDSAWLFDRETRVDETGSFEVRAIDPARPYELEIECDTLANHTRENLQLQGGRELFIEASLAHGATLRGKVIDPQGTPVGNAEVHAIRTVMWGFPGGSTAETESADDGSFILHGVPSGQAQLMAKAPGYLESAIEKVEVEDRMEYEEVLLSLESGNTISGTVIMSDGEPVPSARVTVNFDPEAMMGMGAMNMARGAKGKATSDPTGAFAVTGLGKGPFLVKAESTPEGAEFQWTAQAKGIPPKTEGLELVLQPPSEIRGRVVDEVGDPIRKFSLVANSDGAIFFMPGEARSEHFEDENGEFALRNIPDGRWEIVAKAEGFGPSSPAEVMLPLPGRVEPLILLMRPAAGISGSVLDADGDAISGAKVSLQVDSSKTFAKLTGRLELPETYSDEEGGFLLSALSQGELAVVASHPDYAASKPARVEVEAGVVTEEVTLQLRRGGTLSGEVYDREGRPMAGGQMFVQDLSTMDTLTLRTETDGTFLVERLRPAQWQVSAMIGVVDANETAGNEGSTDFSELLENMRFTMVEVLEGEETHVVLGAPPEDPVLVEGKVTHAGEAVQEAVVSFIPEGESGFQAMKMDQVGSDGSYELRLDEPGRYLVQVQFFGGTGTQQNNIEFSERIPEGERHELDIALPVGRISGAVHGPDGPLGNARVTLTTEGGIAYGTFMGGQYAEIVTDSAGRYDFQFLRPGSYTVAAGGVPFGGIFGGRSGHGRVIFDGIRVRKGEHVEGIDFRLDQAGDLIGTVRDASGTSVQGAAIFVRDQAGRLLERFSMISTGPDGGFRYNGLSPGEYSVSARVGTRVSGDPIWVKVKEGETSRTDLTLAEGTVLLVRVIDRQGENVDATLSVLDEEGLEVNGMIAYSEILTGFSEGFTYDEQRIGPLSPGTYTVTARSEDGRTSRKPVTLNAQAERKLKIRLK